MSEEEIKTMQFENGYFKKSFELLETENNRLKEQYKKMENHYCKKIKQLQQENKELKEKIEALKELDLYECEADYDYEENLELNYVPFSMEEFLKGDK